MTVLKKYDLTGKEIGQVAIDEALASYEAHGQMIKDYIVALRANARQWSANTKTRAEVSHSTQKPHRQKGLGRARQGSLAAPQYKGGGRVFGPKPKFDQHVKVNRKEKRLAIAHLLAEKIRAEHVHVVSDFDLEEPKTRVIAQFLDALSIRKERILFLGQSAFESFEFEGHHFSIQVAATMHENIIKSVRNLPRANFTLAANANGYDLLLASHLVLTESALKELEQLLLA